MHPSRPHALEDDRFSARIHPLTYHAVYRDPVVGLQDPAASGWLCQPALQHRRRNWRACDHGAAGTTARTTNRIVQDRKYLSHILTIRGIVANADPCRGVVCTYIACTIGSPSCFAVRPTSRLVIMSEPNLCSLAKLALATARQQLYIPVST
jgi:hypothetical protein